MALPLAALTVILVASACGEPLRAPVNADGPGQADRQAGAGTPCVNPGTVRECHVSLPSNAGVHSCFVGVQTCLPGNVWGACGSGSGSTSTQSFQLSLASLSQPLSDAGVCAQNPCDPNCAAFNEDAGVGVQPDGGLVYSWSATDPLVSVPSGFVNKGVEDPCSKASDCNFDTYCDTTTHTCTFYKPGQTNPACPGIDLTAGTPCEDGTYPICNRGTVDLERSEYEYIDVYMKNGGGNQFGTACPTDEGSPACRVPVPSQGIPAGTCINAPACGNGGNVTLFVNAINPDIAGLRNISECFLGAEQGCANNWTDVKGAGACSTTGVRGYTKKVYIETYTATCPTGKRPQWTWFSYDTTTPSSNGQTSRITLEARTAPVVDGGAGTYGAYTSPPIAVIPDSAPNTCAMSAGGVNGCPKDLYAALRGLPDARNGALELRVTLDPSPDGQVAPTLKSWQVSYTCPDTE